MIDGKLGRAPSASGYILLATAIGLTLIGKIGALLRDVLLAYSFGVGPSIDAYFIANIIPGLLWAAVIATIAAVVLPLYVEQRSRDVAAARSLAVQSVRLYVIAGIIMAGLVWFSAPMLVRITAPDASPSTLELAVTLTRVMSAGFVFTGYVGVQSALLQANGRYLAPLTVPVVNHMITAGAILIAGYVGNVTIAIAGAVLGWVIQAPIQRTRTLPYYRFELGWRVRPEVLKRVVLLSLPISVGIFLDQANIYIGIMLASGFGDGAVSHLSYAGRLALFMANLVSWLVAYFLFPRIAAHAARGDDRNSGRDLGAGMVLITGLTLPILVVALLFGRDIISLVYGRGDFGPEAISATTAVFGFYAMGIVFMGLRELLNRAFFSYQRTTVPMIAGLLAAGANLAASLALSPIYGVAGIAMGAAISALVFVLIQVGVILVWKPQLIDKHAVLQMSGLLIAGGLAAASAYFIAPALAGLHFFSRLVAGAILTALVYCVASAVLDRALGLKLLDVVRALKDTNIPDDPEVISDPKST